MPPKRNVATTTITPMTDTQIKALIAQGVVDALAERDADRSNNGDDSHDSGSDGRVGMVYHNGGKEICWNPSLCINNCKFTTRTVHSNVPELAEGVCWNSFLRPGSKTMALNGKSEVEVTVMSLGRARTLQEGCPIVGADRNRVWKVIGRDKARGSFYRHDVYIQHLMG
ncbi:hypothetical protein Tco_0694094 [Tanacetum coccineum]